MTETRRNKPMDGDHFISEVLAAVEGARDAGAISPDDIATCLNRSGVSTWRGRQWDAELVLEFLASPEVERFGV